MRVRHLACLALCLLAVPAAAAEPDTSRGDRLLEAYFRRQVKEIADGCLADVKTREDWERKRPELRRQFLDMMGLWPLPPRTDLKPVVTGKVDAEHFTIEKLHFQSVPGLYVTANLYVPKKTAFPAPAVLYVCGHGASVIDKVSYGNKVTYQHHPAWLAEHGYVCLIVDTLQLGELQGLHHGTHNLKMWWWQTLGYTPAGIETWNGVRALDYLETRKEVDPKRIGVTGRSGGGATSWWVAAADDRVQCVIPVAGIADLEAHVVEGVAPRYRDGVISGHCDCMYFVNTYRWDFATVAALCAPRPLMLGNSDADDIFPVPGYRRLAEKTRRVYELYGAAEKFVVLETAGPHRDTPELRLGAYGWLNRWLKNDPGEVTEREWVKLPPPQLKVFDRPPGDAINATVHETFLRPARTELPRSAEVVRAWWPGKRAEWEQALRERVFRGWPEKLPPLDPKTVCDFTRGEVRVRAINYTSEEGVELQLWIFSVDRKKDDFGVLVHVLDEAGWKGWVDVLGLPRAQPVTGDDLPKLKDKEVSELRGLIRLTRRDQVFVLPRGIGPTRWAEEGTAEDFHVRRRFALLGQTLDGQRVLDVRRGIRAVLGQVRPQAEPLRVSAAGEMAGVALYAGIFESQVESLSLSDLPSSHARGPTFLNVRRVLDTPQAVALFFPRKVELSVKDKKEAREWEWPLELQKALGEEFLKIHRADAGK
jgi:hypothetical protein